MRLSHREFRAHRQVVRLAALVATGVVALVAATVLFPVGLLGLLGVLALGVLGGYAAVEGRWIVAEYEGDLREVRSGRPGVSGALAVEVVNRVEVDQDRRVPRRARPSRRSPGSDTAIPDPRPIRPGPAAR